MKKSGYNFHTTFDFDIYIKFSSVVGDRNVTKTLQNFMEEINNSDNPSDRVNLKILNKDIDELQSSLTEKFARLKQMKMERDNIIKKNEEADKQKLLVEKERLEKASRFICCGRIIEKDSKIAATTKIGVICPSCLRANHFNDEILSKWGYIEFMKDLRAAHPKKTKEVEVHAQ